MKLNSRSQAHALPSPIEPSTDSTQQTKIKLIYNGNTFNYIPRRMLVSKEDKTDWLTVTLIYRGNTFERQLPPPKPYEKPRAINWRWQLMAQS